MPSGEAAHQF